MGGGSSTQMHMNQFAWLQHHVNLGSPRTTCSNSNLRKMQTIACSIPSSKKLSKKTTCLIPSSRQNANKQHVQFQVQERGHNTTLI